MTRALLTLALLTLCALIAAATLHTASLVAGRGAGDWGVEWQRTAVAEELMRMGEGR